jgi:hypothetical protein
VKARDNPFSTDRVLAVRYQPQDWTWEELFDRLELLHYRAAIVGPEGSGKTTLLEDLEPRIRAEGYQTMAVRLDRDKRWFDSTQLEELRSAASFRAVILLDGLEQLTFLRWRQFRRLTRRAGGLIATSHRAFRLPVLVRTETSVSLLDRIVSELLPAASDSLSTELFIRHRGNIRDALRELYDRQVG